MKKYSFIAIVVLAGALAACTQKELLPLESLGPDAWIYDETLPVPIQFQSGDIAGMETKALPIDDIDDVQFRVLMMDNISTYAQPKTGDPVFLDMIWAKSTSGNVSFLDGENGSVVHKYYPMSADTLSRYNYSFFAARYPTSGSSSVVNAPSEAYVTFPLRTGDNDIYNLDILHASASAPSFEDGGEKYMGFNARYIRKARELGRTDFVPALGFYHVASQIVIKVKASDATAAKSFYEDANGNDSYDNGETVKLKVGNFSITPRYSSAKLDLLTGALTPTDAATYDGNSYAFFTGEMEMPTTTPKQYPYSETDSGNSVGIFIIPGERTNYRLDANRYPVYYKENNQIVNDASGYPQTTDASGNPVVVTSPSVSFIIETPLNGEQIQMTKELRAPTGGFLPGKVYEYTLAINSLEDVVATATISEPWVSGTLDSGDDEIPVG